MAGPLRITTLEVVLAFAISLAMLLLGLAVLRAAEQRQKITGLQRALDASVRLTERYRDIALWSPPMTASGKPIPPRSRTPGVER